jgi:hypothetical protein
VPPPPHEQPAPPASNDDRWPLGVQAAAATPAEDEEARWELEEGELGDADIDEWLNSLFTAATGGGVPQ